MSLVGIGTILRSLGGDFVLYFMLNNIDTSNKDIQI